jgi:3-oxoadipate enol-lactonase
MRLYHRFDGPGDAPVLVFSNSIATTLELWDAQVRAFTPAFRVLRYDQLGHGRSEVRPRPYTVEQLGRGLLALLDELGIEHVSFCGLSLGGAVGMWLGAHAPERLDRLVLAGTSAYFGPPERWLDRIALVQAEGMGLVAEAAMGRWFTPAFTGLAPYREGHASTPAEGYVACCDALAVWDFRSELLGVSVPTLVVVGADDPATPPDQAKVIAEGIPGARLVVVPAAAHLVNVEQPGAFNRAVLDHLLVVEPA